MLDHLVDVADCRILEVTGVEAEQAFVFVALEEVCGRLLDHLDRIPEQEAQALRVTFGLRPEPVPDRVLAGLAMRSLLAEVATTRQAD